MSLLITVVPASTNAGKETIRQLLLSHPQPRIRAIYRDPSRAPAEYTRHSNFEAIKGDVGNGSSLDFGASDAVFFIPPPVYDGTDTGDWAERISANVQDAIRRAPSVKKLVLHSAFASHHDHDIGVLRLNHIVDKRLGSAAPEVLIVKPGWYHEMFADAFRTMKENPPYFESPMSPANHKLPMVSVQDIGEYCTKTLLDSSSHRLGLRTVTMFGPRLYSSQDIKEAVEEITGKQASMKIIQKEELVSWFEGHVPKSYAPEFAELICALLPGGIMEDDFESAEGEDVVRGKVEMVDSLRRVAPQM